MEKYNEFVERTKDITAISVGTISLERQKYDVYSEKLPITVKFFDWAKKYGREFKGYIIVNRFDAQILCSENLSYDLRCQFVSSEDNILLYNFHILSRDLKRNILIEGDFLGDYFYGELCFENKNYKESILYYKKSAEQGYSKAIEKIGDCYHVGNGVLKSDEEAFKWYLKAANLGAKTSKYWIGEFYFHGTGTERNYEEAFKWYLKAAEEDDTSAICMIGQCYNYGFGIKQDYNKALKWYKKALELGDVYAKTEIKLLMSKI